MRTTVICLLLISQSYFLYAQSSRKDLSEKIDTTNLDLKALGEKITVNEKTDYAKARVLLNWVSNRLEWKATDYQVRTVKEIMARQGGNCYELASVYKAMINAMNLRSRSIAEINVQRPSEEREKSATELIKTKGLSASVFGRRHNDHRWIEIYDAPSNKWLPVDPTMNVIGTEQWLKARLGFEKRITIDTSITNDMIAPFAIFVTDNIKKHQLIEDRSSYYLITEFDNLYHNQLSKLPSWKRWVNLITILPAHAKLSLEGKENLHNYAKQIAELGEIYESLKEEYLSSQKKKS